MFQTVFFSTLLTFIFIESVKNMWTCNTSDTELTYSSCDDKKPIPTIDVRPCLSWKKTKGNLSLYYVPRRDMKDLYFNIQGELKSSVILPLRKAVLCRGTDGDYSFCKVLKGETINTTVGFSYTFLKMPKASLPIGECDICNAVYGVIDRVQTSHCL